MHATSATLIFQTLNSTCTETSSLCRCDKTHALTYTRNHFPLIILCHDCSPCPNILRTWNLNGKMPQKESLMPGLMNCTTSPNEVIPCHTFSSIAFLGEEKKNPYKSLTTAAINSYSNRAQMRWACLHFSKQYYSRIIWARPASHPGNPYRTFQYTPLASRGAQDPGTLCLFPYPILPSQTPCVSTWWRSKFHRNQWPLYHYVHFK